MASDPVEEPKSHPLQVFEGNLDNLQRLHKLLGEYAENTANSVRDASLAILRHSSTTTSTTTEPVDLITPALNNIRVLVDDLLKNMTFLGDWEIVMLVSFVEAYLEDVLIALAQKNPNWMRESTQSISYDQLIRATSLPELIGRMQRQWAKNIINGTPPQWIGRLKNFGVTGYRAELGRDMKAVWDKRNLVVHSPRTPAKVKPSDFAKALGVVQAFVEPTDRFLISFLAG